MIRKFFIIVIAVLFISVGSATASSIGDIVSGVNITKYDGDSSSSSGWHGMQEDNEVEPGCLTGQEWDLGPCTGTLVPLRFTWSVDLTS